MAANISKIPPIGFGLGTTWYKTFIHNTQGDLDQTLIDSLLAALRAGFRHIDLAEMYGNEREVGVALGLWFAERESSGESRDAARADLWITSKLWESMNEDVVEGCRATVQRAGCEYLDLYLMHGSVALLLKKKPSSRTDLTNIGIWRQLEQLVDAKLVRSLGLSNFAGSEITELCSHPLKHAPVMHQVEFHPFLQQPELQRVSESHGIKMASYGGLVPLRKETPAAFSALLQQIALKHGIPEASVLQRYTLQRGYTVITTTRTASRLHEALNVPNLHLDDEDVAAINDFPYSPLRSFWGPEIQVPDAGFI